MTQEPLELLARKTFPDLAASVRSAYPTIESRWIQSLREALASAVGMSWGQLRDDLPLVMEHVARSIESDRPDAVRRLSSISPMHGKVRFNQNFGLDDILIEHSLLRAVVIVEVTRQLGRDATIEESVALNAALDLVGRQATATYVAQQTLELKAETEAQSKYLSFLSHDLRGELNGVFLMIEVLRRELVKEPKFGESLEDLDMMRRSMSQTIATMDRFLHAERFRKGKVQPRPSEVNLSGVLAEVGAQVSYQIKEKGLGLEILQCAPCRLTTDRELVMLILQNLVANAIKYSKKGVIRIAADADSTATGGMIISVKDEGHGIAADKIEELFATFARGETHGQQGSGLGLSIAKQAAEILGGKLWAESELGVGTTFFLRLPPALPPAPATIVPVEINASTASEGLILP